MFRQSCSYKLIALSLALIGVTMPAYAQKKKQEGKKGQGALAGQQSAQDAVNIEIRNVSRNDSFPAPANLVERKK